MLLAAVVLYRFPPERYGIYPGCPVYEWTGWDCPGCGMTRALAALVHGRLAEAVVWNPLVLVVAGGFVAWVVVEWRGVRWPRVPGFAVAAMVVAAGLFMIGRNL